MVPSGGAWIFITRSLKARQSAMGKARLVWTAFVWITLRNSCKLSLINFNITILPLGFIATFRNSCRILWSITTFTVQCEIRRSCGRKYELYAPRYKSVYYGKISGAFWLRIAVHFSSKDNVWGIMTSVQIEWGTCCIYIGAIQCRLVLNTV